jgi:type IV secretory pathway VirB2 component (pilin)
MIKELLAQAKIDNSKLTKLPEVKADQGSIGDIMAVVFGVAGAIAVLIVVIAGLNLITGGDNPEKISRAKNAIIYSLIGLAIVLLAYSIVITLLGQF